jgi:RHS repeat-associated protein
VTLPTTFTQIETRLRDGRSLSVTGTAVVGEFYDYGIETDGRRRTKVSARSANDVRKQESWTDWLGRAAKRERPGFNGTSTYTETMEYAATTGQLTVLNRTGYAATRYEYNGMGEAVRTGLDLNGTAGLQPASKDRISDSDTSVESYDGAYWVTSKSWAFHLHNTDAKKLVGQSRRRLTGLSPTLRGETRSWDAEDNESRRSVSVDVATKVVTATTTRPGLASAATEVSVNGFAVVSTGHDGLAYRQTYDALGRVQSVIDPRTGTANAVSGANFSITYVPNTALPFERRDGSNKLLSSTAYDGAGRPIMTQNADSRTSRVAYTARGQVEYQWGSAGYPVSYGYDGYGQRTHLRTYRDPSNSVSNYWEATTWPGGAVAAQDTEWAFDDYTGLLKKKYDASRQYTEYTYNTRGQTHQRFWARTVPTGPNAGQRITTTYAYVAGTGEPQSISYNDGITPGVSYLPGGGGEAYTRLGQPVAVTDATGERSFGYDATKPWRLTGETLSSTFYGSRALASLYEENTTANTGDLTYTGHTISTVKGRYRGYRLGVNPTAGSYDLEQSYAGSAAGRLAGLETKRANGSVARQFIYGYETASPLLKSLAIVGNAFQVTRTFEAKRDLLTQIDSKWSGGALRTSYAYTYNDLRQRATAVQGGGAGEAFAELGATHQRFAYNSRGELTAGTGYHGSDPAATDKPLDARRHAYDYDAIGNRKWSNSSGNAVVRDDYTANDLNQYTQRENNTLAVSGTANASAKVAVSGPMPAPDGGQVRAGRPTGGTYWGSNVVVNNAATTAEGKGVPFVGDVKAYAALAGAGAGGADLFRVETKAAWLPPVVQAFAYDVDGNLTSDGLWDYRWDAENRLIRMQTTGAAATVASAGRPNQTLEFTYDYRHRRVKKKVINMATSTVTSERKFIYDGWNVIAETDVGGTIKRSFAWGLDISGSAQGAGGVGGLLQIHDYEQTKTLFPCYDGNGNIGALINAEGTAGTIEASYEYTPFGELQRCAGAYAAANPFRFSTKWQDDESGLVYYGARYYAPREGRFLGRDPIEEEGGLNLYGFCGNDGVNQTDYLGYSWFSKQLKSIGNWVSKNKQAIITLVAIVAAVVVGVAALQFIEGALVNSVAAGAIAAGGNTLAVSQAIMGAASINSLSTAMISGIVGGAAGGFVAGGITTGTLKGALQGAAAGAIMGGVQGFYGTAFPVDRIAATGVAGGIGSEIQGGSFRDGFKLNGVIAGATWTALWMRNVMIAQSEGFVDPKTGQRVNATGVSDGFNGDRFKLGGGRFDPNLALGDSDQIQPFGGRQGGLRTLFGRPYQAGGFVDRVIESFAGPHDWLGSWWSYDKLGNNSPKDSMFGRLLGNFGANTMDKIMSGVNIPLAAPLVASSWIGINPYSGVALRPRG